MRTLAALLAVLFFSSPLFSQAAEPQSQRALLLISLDGMRPDYVLKADELGLKIPNLRRILRQGAHASGVIGVIPTVTYPNHTTILTGVLPIKHGIYSNVVFDPLNKNLNGWYWYAEDIKAPTLWEAAANAGMQVGSVSWPASVGAKGVSYLIPEFWRAQKSDDDIKLMRIVSTPGLVAELEKSAGLFVADPDAAEEQSHQRTMYAAAILRTKHPQFMTVHLALLDHVQHNYGPFSPEAASAMERLDEEVGELENAARSIFSAVTICIVSDHGFTRTDHNLNLIAPFVEAGLIALNGARQVTDWKAFPQINGGSAAIILKDPHDEATQAKVAELLRRLASDPANGIAQVLDPKEIAAYGGNPAAAFWVDMTNNFAVVANQGPLVGPKKAGGTHGYSPSHADMRAAFFIAGPTVKQGLDLGEIDMRAIAPTLASGLGVPLPSADLQALSILAAPEKTGK